MLKADYLYFLSSEASEGQTSKADYDLNMEAGIIWMHLHSPLRGLMIVVDHNLYTRPFHMISLLCPVGASL